MVKMIVPLLFILLVAFSSPLSVEAATLYQWIGADGNAHVTDDILLVPPKYRDKVKVYETPHVEDKTPPRFKDVKPPIFPKSGRELYGGYPLEWWERKLAFKKKEVADLEQIISDYKRYIGVFRKGRKFGKTFGSEEVRAYEDYKKDIPEKEERLEELIVELEELRRKATIYGVPRSIREKP
jgi:hypothetical protein